jgi:transposase-like protein
MDLLVTDGHGERLAAVSALFSAPPRQRCVVQKQRHVLNAIPQRERNEVRTDLSAFSSKRRMIS